MTPIGSIPSLLNRVRAWPVDSQLESRRNAMVACTALAQRRVEREEVEEFLASLAAEREPRFKRLP